MDRFIVDYLPIVLREVPEFKALMAAQQPELESLWSAQDDVLDNQFLVSAAEYGIGRWERILSIYPKDTDGLLMRRARVLALLRLKQPLTMRWLNNWLGEIVGAGNFIISLNNYFLHIRLTNDVLNLVDHLRGYLREAIPANLALEVEELFKIWGEVLNRYYSTWGGVFANSMWGDIQLLSWGEASVKTWYGVLDPNTWGDVRNYVFEQE